MTCGKNRRLKRIVVGAGAALGLALIVERASSAVVKRMESPDPDLCRGFEWNNGYCVNLGITTAYLLRGKDGYLLIDTGFPGDYITFCDGLGRLGVGLDEIKALLLTHGHDDHAGFAARLLEETGARLIAHRDVVPLLQGEQLTHQGISLLNWRVFVLVMLYALGARRDFGYPPVALDDGDILIGGDDDRILPSLGFDARVIATPGHTRDSISVVTPDGRVFCGDAAMNFLPVSGAQLRPIFVCDRDAVFASWRKMLDGGARVIYPAHGRPFPAERLAAALGGFRPRGLSAGRGHNRSGNEAQSRVGVAAPCITLRQDRHALG